MWRGRAGTIRYIVLVSALVVIQVAALGLAR